MRKNKTSSLLLPDWSQLPKELLHVISEHLDNCFDVIHARSVCSPWRSAFPFPACLSRPSYSLPTFPIEKIGLCNLEKIPVFLFRVQAPVVDSEFFLGEVSRDDSVDHIELLPSPQCSAKVKILQCDSTSMNMLDFQMLSLGYQYKMICWSPEGVKTVYKRVAFLPLNKEGGKEFAVLLNTTKTLLLLTSARRSWTEIQNVPPTCWRLVAFRGRFYATFTNKQIFASDPYSLEATLLMPSPPLIAKNYLVPSGNDELFLVEKSIPSAIQFALRVSRLDEDARKWVEVSDLGDRILFIGHSGNFSCSAKELPEGCGVSGNSILFTSSWPGHVTFFYKYEDITSCWRLAEENDVTIHYASSVLALRVKC